MRDQGRLERDDPSLLAHRLRDFFRDDHGIAPICAQQRAAASSPSFEPPTRKPAAKRVAGTCRVDDRRRRCRVVVAVDSHAVRPELQDPPSLELANRFLLALCREHDVGRHVAQPLTEVLVDQRPRRDVHGHHPVA